MKQVKISLVLILILCLCSTQLIFASSSVQRAATDTIRVLTIGNSFADNASQYLREITQSVEGFHIVIGSANIGGSSLDKHADYIKKSEQDSTFKPYRDKSLKDMLLQEKWDVVTIQQVSHMSYKSETYQPYADEIVDFVNTYSPDAKIYIHQTWAYAPDCERLEGFGITSDQMYKGLKKNYKTLAKHYNSPILKSGDAFNRASKAYNIDLWTAEDRFHANSNGEYLAGCVWFSELFNVSAKKIQFVPEGMSNETAALLRNAASK